MLFINKIVFIFIKILFWVNSHSCKIWIVYVFYLIQTNLLSCALNLSQKSSDKSNLSKIFDFVKTSKIISLESFLLILHVILQIKNKENRRTVCISQILIQKTSLNLIFVIYFRNFIIWIHKNIYKIINKTLDRCFTKH